MIRSLRTKGFTLVEIMIVVAIIGILIAIAVPGFLKAREISRQKSCWETQQKIDAAVQQYILDSNCPDQATAVGALGTDPTTGVAAAQLLGDNNYVRFTPRCPSSGTYELQPTGFAVDCDIPAPYDHSWTGGGPAGS